MDEPPAKRPRRDDPDHTASPRSPRPNDQKSSRRHDDRDDRNGYSRDNDRKRRRSRSPGSRRNRSRDRERSYRDRDRDRYRDGDRRDHRSRKHSRSRSRSPPRTGPSGPKRTRSPPRGPRNDHDRRVKDESKAAVNSAIQEVPMKMEEDEDEEAYMKRVMGFGGFNTTKNKKVPGNQWYGVWKVEKVKYRQYMNRQGGFNRPLSPG